jgi:hypothetical protein
MRYWAAQDNPLNVSTHNHGLISHALGRDQILPGVSIATDCTRVMIARCCVSLDIPGEGARPRDILQYAQKAGTR